MRCGDVLKGTWLGERRCGWGRRLCQRLGVCGWWGSVLVLWMLLKVKPNIESERFRRLSTVLYEGLETCYLARGAKVRKFFFGVEECDFLFPNHIMCLATVLPSESPGLALVMDFALGRVTDLSRLHEWVPHQLCLPSQSFTIVVSGHVHLGSCPYLL